MGTDHRLTDWFSRALRLAAQVIIQDDRSDAEFDWTWGIRMNTAHANLGLNLPPDMRAGEGGEVCALLAQEVGLVCYPLVGGILVASEPPFAPTLTLFGMAPVKTPLVVKPLSAIYWRDHALAWQAATKRGALMEFTDAVAKATSGGFTMEQLRSLLGREPKSKRMP